MQSKTTILKWCSNYNQYRYGVRLIYLSANSVTTNYLCVCNFSRIKNKAETIFNLISYNRFTDTICVTELTKDAAKLMLEHSKYSYYDPC